MAVYNQSSVKDKNEKIKKYYWNKFLDMVSKIDIVVNILYRSASLKISLFFP